MGGKTSGKNVTAVQTPGAPAATDSADTATNQAETATQDTEQAAAKAEPKAGAGKAAAKVRPSRSEFLSMRAADVNPDELDSAVLTMDGWVCPTKAPASK